MLTEPKKLPIQPYSLDRAAALRLLVRFLQHEHDLRLEALKTRLDHNHNLKKTAVDSFLKGTPPKDPEQAYQAIANEVAQDLQAIGDFAGPIQILFDLVYDVPAESGAIEDSAVIGFRSLLTQNAAAEESFLPRLQGLSLMVRRSTEYVSEAGTASEAKTPGYSLSLLNVLPRGVGKGHHHPLFKIKQKGTLASRIVDISGAVVFQDDRFVLSGCELRERRPFECNVHFAAEQFDVYRTGHDPLSGVMLGVSHSKSGFGALFQLYAVPGGTLAPDESNPEAIAAFDKLRKHIDSEAVGVMNRAVLLERLALLGIAGIESHLDEMDRLAREEVVFQYG